MLLHAKSLFKKSIDASAARKASTNPRDIDISQIPTDWKRNRITKTLDEHNIDILQVFIKKNEDQLWAIDYFTPNGKEVLIIRKYTKHDGCLTTYDEQGRFLEKGKFDFRTNKYSKFLTRDMMNKAARISLYIERDAYGNFYWCDNTGCYRIPTDDGDGGDGGDGDDGDGDGGDGGGGDGDGNDCYDADGCACNDTQCKEDKVLALFDFYATDQDWKSEIDQNLSSANRRVRHDYWKCITSATYSVYSVEKVTEDIFHPEVLTQRWKLVDISHDKYIIDGFYMGVNVSVSGDLDVLEMSNLSAITQSHVTISCTGTVKGIKVDINKVFPRIQHTFQALN